MRIRALSVFEGVVYHCVCMDNSNPCRPTLEVDALLRPGDADAEAGPLLLTVSEYAAMVGDHQRARRCVDELAAKGRIVHRLGVAHVSFPTWAPVPDPDPIPDPDPTSAPDPTPDPDSAPGPMPGSDPG